MDKYVITISREFGSGGRGVGKKLAEALGIGCYDKEIIAMTAEKSGLSEGYVQKREENLSGSFLSNIGFSSMGSFDSVVFYETPTTDKMFLSQSMVIRELAAKESCVIIGRCADYVLRDFPNVLHVFIRANKEDRIARAVADYELPTKNAEQFLKKADKSRANYYRFYTNRNWGDPQYIDVSVNTSAVGIDGAVEIVKTAVAQLINK
ncbi:MAG: cytidylate kinase-like family protein [Oscillospiraceae bacterium]|jgi:cytidylate kinase|nr:cytidylate kinase-like family protein [Oscillospiraceae bacterium]